MRARFKRWAEPFLLSHPDIVLAKVSPTDPFFLTPNLYLEIGAGKGDFVLSLASRRPEAHYLAVERDLSISGILGKKVVDSSLPNIRILQGDFDALAEELAPLSFAGIYLNFSDPWPKKKHGKRRLTTRARLAVMAALLAPEGRLYIKTDNDNLYAFTQEEALHSPLALLLAMPDYVYDEKDDAMSEYERNFRSEGKPIHRLVYGLKKNGEAK